VAGPWCAVAVDVNWQLTPVSLPRRCVCCLCALGRQAGRRLREEMQFNYSPFSVGMFRCSCEKNENENGLEIIRMRPLLRELLQPANETSVRAALAACCEP
jgi:hypothetical protein